MELRGIFTNTLGHSTIMGVSENRGTLKWMVKIMENPIKMDDLGPPLFLEATIISMQIAHKFEP